SGLALDEFRLVAGFGLDLRHLALGLADHGRTAAFGASACVARLRGLVGRLLAGLRDLPLGLETQLLGRLVCVGEDGLALSRALGAKPSALGARLRQALGGLLGGIREHLAGLALCDAERLLESGAEFGEARLDLRGTLVRLGEFAGESLDEPPVLEPLALVALAQLGDDSVDVTRIVATDGATELDDVVVVGGQLKLLMIRARTSSRVVRVQAPGWRPGVKRYAS